MTSLVRYAPRTYDVFGNFDRFFNGLFPTGGYGPSGTPVVDIQENESGYVLEAELPGFADDDLDVKVNDNLLTIAAETKSENDSKKEGYLLRERKSRSFQRSFVLPRDVDKESIEASFENGVLTLNLQKTSEAKPKQIEVNKPN